VAEQGGALAVGRDPDGGAAARTPSQLARRDRIIQAATELLEEREYERIQIRHVAEAASVALATLYRYFPSKEQLYAQVLVAWSESFDTRVRVQNRQAATDADRLRAALRQTVRAYERHPNFFRLVSALEVVTDPAVSERFMQFASRFTDALADTLLDTAEEERASIAFVTSTVLGGVLRGWSVRGTPIGRVYERVDEVVDLIFSGPRNVDPG
jgi:AcrR family transcriptional regulator